MDIVIRIAASEQDFLSALDIRHSVFIEEQGINEELERDTQDTNATHAIAEISGKIVATGRFTIVMRGGERIAHVGRMAVLINYRRQGIATKVLAALEAEAKRQGLFKIELHSQEYIQSFYIYCGYQAEGPIFLEAGIEHITMSKMID